MTTPSISTKRRVSKKASSFTESVIREMTREALKHGAVNLSQGFPDFAAPEDIKRRAMEYIVAAYAPDKLNDPSQAEPIVQKMIQMDPSEPTAYFQLSKIYEDAGRYEEAEQALLKARDARPNDPTVWSSIAG